MAKYSARDSLYSPDELLEGFEADDPIGFASTYDFRTFQQFMLNGGPNPSSIETRLAQATHDAHIAAALAVYLQEGLPLVSIMGGHKLSRDHRAYRQIASLCFELANAGFLIASGGGPGAMEAAHVGASCAPHPASLLAATLDILKDVPEIPRLGGIVGSDGKVDPARRGDLENAHQWMLKAMEAKDGLPPPMGPSLAIPTWLYGQEPTMPFATAYAKFFQNSIREEALVTQARAGIVYARGRGGTIREIFQDVEENFYAPSAEQFEPMIFFDPDRYWERDAELDLPNKTVRSEAIRLDETLQRVFTLALIKLDDREEAMSKIRFTTDSREIIDLLRAHIPETRRRFELLLEGRAADLSYARWSR